MTVPICIYRPLVIKNHCRNLNVSPTFPKTQTNIKNQIKTIFKFRQLFSSIWKSLSNSSRNTNELINFYNWQKKYYEFEKAMYIYARVGQYFKYMGTCLVSQVRVFPVLSTWNTLKSCVFPIQVYFKYLYFQYFFF